MILKNPITIDPNDLEWGFVRSSGPGGQNVNKVATAVQLRFHLRECKWLHDDVKERLMKIAKNRMTREGDLIISSQRYRSQLQNRDEAIRRLTQLIEKAMEKPKIRHRTKPSHAAKKRRLEAKRQISEKKRLRSKNHLDH